MDASAAYLIARTLKSGNINQGYAQCEVDQLSLMVEQGKCSPERIQCRQAVTLRSTLHPIGVAFVFSVRPVGAAFARELILAVDAPTVAIERSDWIVTQIASKGRIAYTGTVTSTGLGNQATGAPLNALGINFQNYVLPSGIVFDSANTLDITILNAGPGPGTGNMVAMLTYDELRMG